MKIVIVGGGIVAAYMAKKFYELSPDDEVTILTKEDHPPYDRIHLCDLVDGQKSCSEIALGVPESIDVRLEEPVTKVDKYNKKVFTCKGEYEYDTLILATGSRPRKLFDISKIDNASTFRSAQDSFKISHNIEGRNVVIMGVGPIGLELLETLRHMQSPRKIYLVSRGKHLYDKEVNPSIVKRMERTFEANDRVKILYGENIQDVVIEDNLIKEVQFERLTIENPFIIFGVGINPNCDFVKGMLETRKGVLVDENMQTSDPSIYAVGEVAEVRESSFIAGRVKECTRQADAALHSILGLEEKAFKQEVGVDGLKVGAFLLADVTSPSYIRGDEDNEEILISSKKDNRIDQYIINKDKLVKFVGFNTNVDVLMLKAMIENDESIDPSIFYSGRLLSEKGRLICSCSSIYEQDITDIIKENAVTQFSELAPYTDAGRVCGRCRQDIVGIIQRTPVDPLEAKKIRKRKQREKEAKELEKVHKRLDKYNRLHASNTLSVENLNEAIETLELNNDFNKWVSMITANMKLDPMYEGAVTKSVGELNKIPIIWLELADCTGNSEAFIKSANPKIDDLILKYISLDYHDLLMASAGDQSENQLDKIIEEEKGKYVLIVEGAIPLAMEGKYLRKGPKGETGEALLKRAAQDAAMVLSVGTCAYDGGVVAAEPNPTGAVGVKDVLKRKDIINLPGCPVNPINVVGTLLHYIMFEELPKLDEKNRPLWAYQYRIHDNCERRGHFDLGEFVLEWGDEGAKKGWCLYKMGCKGPYANLNCSLMKFNEGSSWPVQVGHGCFGCGEGKHAFDKWANQRELEEEN